MPEGIQAGMQALDQATNLPFPEFTAKLVTSTFDAVVSATVHQMEAYAKLVADLSKTLSEFQAENITEAEISKFLSDYYPNGNGGTSVSKDNVFKTIPASGDSPEVPAFSIYEEIFKDLVDVKLKSQWNTENQKPAITSTPSDKKQEGNFFTETQVTAIRGAVGRSLASSMMEHLRAMAREGMARIVVDNGEILSKLTFNVETTDIDAKSKQDYHRDSKSAYIRGGACGGWWGVKAGASYSSMNVKIANENTFSKVTMDAELIGQVKINFHTETFPAITTTPGN